MEKLFACLARFTHIPVFAAFQREAVATVDLKGLACDCISAHIASLFAASISESVALRELDGIVGPTIAWCYSAFAKQRTRGAVMGAEGDPPPMRQVIGVEEMLWCPVLGMKGQIDVIGKVGDAVLMPVELKTGKLSSSALLSHRAQVSLVLTHEAICWSI